MLLKKHRLYLYITLLAILSLFVTIVNLGFEKNFIGEDSGVALDYPNTLVDQTYYMWDSHRAPGKANVSSVFNFIWNNFILLLSYAGLSGFMIKRVLFFLYFFCASTGVYYLVNFLLSRHYQKNSGSVLFASFVAGLIYVLNPYSMQLASFPIINYHNSYIFFPWVFLMFLHVLQIPPKINYVIAFSFLLVVAFSANPSNTIVIMAFILIYFLFFIRFYLSYWKQNITFLSSSLLLIIILFSFVLFPILVTQTNIYGIENVESLDFFGSIRLHSTFTSFLNLFRLVGSREWPTFPYSGIYDKNLLFLILTYLTPVAAFSALLFSNDKKMKTFFILTIILFVFFAKGLHDPIPELLAYLFKTYPLLGMFRAVYFKFVFPVVLSYAVLIGYTIVEIIEKKYFIKNPQLLKIVIVFLIFLNNFPFFTGLIPKKEYLNNIPAEYTRLEEFFRDKPGGKILSLPETPIGAGPLMKWNQDVYIGPPADHFFTDRPTIDGYWYISEKFPGVKQLSWSDTDLVEKSDQLVNTAGVLDIKYFIVHKDYLKEYEFPTSSGMVNLNGPLKAKIAIDKFRKNPRLKLIYNTANFAIFERIFLTDWNKIYLPQQILFTDNVKNKLFSFENKSAKTYAVFSLLKSGQDKVAKISNQADITYKEHNPTSYSLSLKHAKYPLLLVFSETYHPQWRLTDSNGRYIPEDRHFKVNGYANAWIIDNGNNFNLEFIPQKYFNLGLIITILTLLSCLLILGRKLFFKLKK